jgi:NADPH:quinone reductase
MTNTNSLDGLILHSTIQSGGTLRITLDNSAVSPPGNDEVLVRIEAAPINPSDIGLLLGAVDLATLNSDRSGDDLVLVGTVPTDRLAAMQPRFDQMLPVGNEGAGTVVAAGSGAEQLLGRTVAVFGGAMYAQYRTLPANQCMPLLTGTTAAQGAAAFVNPLTALGMVETLRMEGHTALVHTAAASNLGQMLVRLCKAEGIPLVNIVRSEEQEQLLRDIGADYVCNSRGETFRSDLLAAISATGATLAFDATGGGTLASDILTAMEQSLTARGNSMGRYGSSVHKQVYIYGGLDIRTLSLSRNFGLAWGVGGWLLTPFLEKIGPARANALQTRVAAEITTTFASRFAAEISMHDMLDPETVRSFSKRATGEKFLLNPSLPLAW